MERLQRVTLSHRFLVILVAMLAGFMLMFSLLGGMEIWPGTILQIPVYGTSEGWVRAHSVGAMNGLLVVAVGLSLPKMGLRPVLQRVTAYGFILMAWWRRASGLPQDDPRWHFSTSTEYTFSPPVFLKSGDVVRVEIEKLGHLENKVVQEVADTLIE